MIVSNYRHWMLKGKRKDMAISMAVPFTVSDRLKKTEFSGE